MRPIRRKRKILQYVIIEEKCKLCGSHLKINYEFKVKICSFVNCKSRG